MDRLYRLGNAGLLAFACCCVGQTFGHFDPTVAPSGPASPPRLRPSPVTNAPGVTSTTAPQVMADISAEVLRFYANKPIERVKPFSNEILGACVTGTGTTLGRATAELVPCETQAAFDLIATGRTWTEAISRKRPVSLCTRGIVDFTVRTRVYFDQTGLRFETPIAAARNQTDLTGICSDLARILDPIVLPAAKRRYEKTKPEALEIADRQAERRYVEETTTDLEPEIAKGNASFSRQLAVLEKRQVRIGSLRMKSSTTAITVSATLAEMALPVTPAPSYSSPGDLGLRIHEVAVTTLASREVAGKTLTPEKIDARIEEITGKKRVAATKRAPFSATFPSTDPVSIRFDQHRIEVVARLDSFTSDGEEYRGVDVTIRYQFFASSTGIVAQREAIDVYPTGYVPGSGKPLSARQIATSRVLKDRLADELKPQITLDDLRPTGRFEKLGPLEVVSTGTQFGWLLIAWKRKFGGQESIAR